MGVRGNGTKKEERTQSSGDRDTKQKASSERYERIVYSWGCGGGE